MSKSNAKFYLSLTFIAAIFLSGCAAVIGTDDTGDVCPPPQYADAHVAEELENIPFEGYEDFWAWMARVEKLNEALEACHG